MNYSEKGEMVKWTHTLILDLIGIEDSSSIIVWLMNIGVEDAWYGGDLAILDTDPIELAMEEMCLLLTKKQDILILRNSPEQEYLQDLEDSGFEIPTILIPDVNATDISITELVLKDKKMLTYLQSLSTAETNVYFAPFGISEKEEQLATACNLQLIGSTTSIQGKINDKVFAKAR